MTPCGLQWWTYRAIFTSDISDLHLTIRPDSDQALLHGLVHLLVKIRSSYE
jgi:anaerobic selenocysteine-containing dehydrogenase